MYKSLWLIVVLALVACGGEVRNAVPATPVVEAVASDPIVELLKQFPIQPRMLSDKETLQELARLRLHPVVLTRDTIMLNYFRNIRKFVRDTIRAGTMVYADESGMVRYKADCWNLLAEVSACRCVVSDTSSATTVSQAGDVVEASEGSSFWEGIWEDMRTIFGLFLMATLGLILLGLLAWLVRQIFRFFVPEEANPGPVLTPLAPPAPLPHEGGRRRHSILPVGVGRRHGEQDRRYHHTVLVGFGRRRGETDRRSGNDRRDWVDRRRG